MCIAIYCRAKAERLSLATLKTCAAANPDGMGLVYPDGAGGLHTFHTLTDVDALWQQHLASEGQPCLLHFRIATQGSVCEANCHPFILPGPTPIALIHNGILDGVLVDGDESDTRAFVRMLGELPDGWWDNSTMHELIEGYINPSKVVMMTGDGVVRLFNAFLGHWVDDVWYSNDSYKPKLGYVRGASSSDRPLGYYVVADQKVEVVCMQCLQGIDMKLKDPIMADEAALMDAPWCDWCNRLLGYDPPRALTQRFCYKCNREYSFGGSAPKKCPECKTKLRKNSPLGFTPTGGLGLDASPLAGV